MEVGGLGVALVVEVDGEFGEGDAAGFVGAEGVVAEADEPAGVGVAEGEDVGAEANGLNSGQWSAVKTEDGGWKTEESHRVGA